MFTLCVCVCVFQNMKYFDSNNTSEEQSNIYFTLYTIYSKVFSFRSR